MKQKEEELEAKLIEVNDQLKQQSVIDEYEAKITSLQNEQLLITQVRSGFCFFFLSMALELTLNRLSIA